MAGQQKRSIDLTCLNQEKTTHGSVGVSWWGAD
jgi:hypothetical protein